MPNATSTLRTGIAQGKMVFLGKGGSVDGQVNPTLAVYGGDVAQITIVNGEGAEHDLSVPEMHVGSQRVTGPAVCSRLLERPVQKIAVSAITRTAWSMGAAVRPKVPNGATDGFSSEALGQRAVFGSEPRRGSHAPV